MFSRLVMKLPAKPTKPYIRHSAQTLRDVRKRRHGTGPAGGGADRPARISSRSAELTRGISAGRLRNHHQKKTAQIKPTPPRTTDGIVQLPNTPLINHTTSTGATDPPRRLNVQTRPGA